MNSWKTTISGILAALGVLIGMITACLDGSCDWTAIITQVMIVLGLFGIGSAARDNDKSSESVGAR